MIDSQQASAALDDINDVVQRVRQSRIYQIASLIVVMWGVLVFAAYIAIYIWPRQGYMIWTIINLLGLVISVKGYDGTQILDNYFSGQSGTAIFVWGDGRGADDTLIEGNKIDQAAAREASPIASRAAEDVDEGVLNKRLTVRGNTIDQGDATTGWFGIELKLSPGAIVADNDVRGGRTLVSLPDSDGVIVSGNRLDLRGSAVWGVEIAKSNDVIVEDNTFIGDGPGSKDVAVSMNSGSLRALISANRAEGLGTLVNLTGDDHHIADNCLADVGAIMAYRTSAGLNVDVARNGPCPVGRAARRPA